jgi:hypothetical protein
MHSLVVQVVAFENILALFGKFFLATALSKRNSEDIKSKPLSSG